MRNRDAIVAGAWGAALGGAPSIVHALVTGRDSLEAAKATGALLLPGETRTLPLLAASVPVHLGLSLGWAFVLERAGIRGAARGATAGLAIAALDIGALGRRFPRMRTLPQVPQVADHLAYGAVAGWVLARRSRD